MVTLASRAIRFPDISAVLGHKTTLGKTLPLSGKPREGSGDTGAPESGVQKESPVIRASERQSWVCWSKSTTHHIHLPEPRERPRTGVAGTQGCALRQPATAVCGQTRGPLLLSKNLHLSWETRSEARAPTLCTASVAPWSWYPSPSTCFAQPSFWVPEYGQKISL